MYFVCNGYAGCIAVSVSHSNACNSRNNYSCRSESLQILMKGADRNENSCCQKSESVQRNSENDFRNKKTG